MFTYTPQDLFADARCYDTSDPVLGGVGGASNEPLVNLADRSQYIYNRLGRFLGQRIIAASGNITASDKFVYLKCQVTDNITQTLAAVSTFQPGAMIWIKAAINATGKAVAVVPNGSEQIKDGNKTFTASSPNILYLCDGEQVLLMAIDTNADNTPDAWEMIIAPAGLYMAGNDGLFRVPPRNTMIANGNLPEQSGSLSNRADFPRLVQATVSQWVSDALWLSNIRYRQFFSNGNGTTTFRFPDMRSMVWKGLDLGRGLSLNRLDNAAGGIELDQVKEHYHNTTFNPNSDSQSGSGKLTVGGASNEGVPPVYKSAGAIDNSNNSIGGVENLIKTTGLIPVIFY